MQTELHLYRAQRSASCLLAPGVGDKVLLVTDSGDGAYVLAVLERGAGPALLDLPADTAISSAGGSLNLSARDGIVLGTPGTLALQGSALEVGALTATVRIGQLSFIGECWDACVERMKLVGRSVDTVLERCHQRITRSYRFIDTIDQVKAGQIDYQSDTTLALHAQHTLVTADGLVKVDGDQIHVG